jgi:tetratricopeptide (TPR) repeat protein
LAQARDELQCAQWYDEAIAHCESERWVEACRTWTKVLRGRLGYRNGDAAARLLDAVEGLLGQLETVRELFNKQQRALDRATEALCHYDTLAVAMEEEQWDKAIKAAERLSKLVPDLEHVQSWPYVAIKRLIEAQGVDAPAWLGSEGLPSGEEAVAWLEQLAARKTSDGDEKAEGRTEPRMERTTRDLGIEHRQT